MPDPFSERDAADLLRRAALLQAQAADRDTGLSLDEVKRAAEAAGIDPRFVEQAALGAGHEMPAPGRAFGLQTGAQRTRVVAGHVSDDEWGQMVSTLRRQLGGTGAVETIGRIRHWRRAPVEITVEPEGENTRITAAASWSGEAKFIPIVGIASIAVALVVAVIGVVTASSGAFGFAAMMVAYAAFCGWGWTHIRRRGPRYEGQFDRAMEALTILAGSDERAEAPEPEARIDAALLDADAPDASATPRRHQARS